MHYKILVLLPMLFLLGCKISNKTNDQKEQNTTGLNLCGPTTADLNTQPGHDGTLSPLYEGLDVYEYPISTKSALAQRYFNQGFMLNYGFNHAEASRSFREAIRQDEDCAMCYWGLAYVLGPNYNAGMEPEVLLPANEALQKARLLLHKASPKEQALINALSKRYPKSLEIDPAPYYAAYAEAMRGVMKTYPEDLDIAVMTAEALMDLHPWDLWLKDGTAQPWTPEIVDILETALNKDPDHPQATHLYIHAVEASKEPEVAKEAADRLRFRVPGSGHLLHMPSHLYINTGHYYEGTMANERAVIIDSTYVEACHAAGIYPLAYYPHNWHFLAACAALEGRGDRALEASRYMADYVVDKELMYEPPMSTLQHFYTIPWYIMVKFAMWDALLAEAAPDAKLPYPTAVWHYAQGMAYAGKGDIYHAEQALAKVRLLEQDPTIAEMTIWDINAIKDVVGIAKLVLAGEIEHRKGNLSQSITLLQQAVALEDQLNYNEPPDWFFSVRHILGDVLIKNEQYKEAEKVYLEDLEELRNNGWALTGLLVSLEKQGKKKEVGVVKSRLEKAWKRADVELENSVVR